MKIIHMGDVHLDSSFSGLDPDRAEVRRNELRATFTSALAYAGMEKADMVIISGDLFDMTYATRETVGLIKREFEKLTCPIIITPGNHDPATPDSIWRKNIFPGNTYVFTEENVTSFDFPELNTTVYGWAFASHFRDGVDLTTHGEINRERINILCGHGDLASLSSRTCPLSLGELSAFGADYVALGHIHNPAEYGDGIMYCGCLEPRGFDEVGIKGISEVSIEKDGMNSHVSARRVRFAKRRYEKRELDVTGASVNGDVFDRIDRFVTDSGLGTDTLLRLRLTGNVSPEFVINRAGIESMMNRLFSLTITDDTSPVLTEDELMKDHTLRGEFFRVLLPKLNSDDENERRCAADALRYGLAALTGGSLSEGVKPEGAEFTEEVSGGNYDY